MLAKGEPGDVYNIGASNQKSNLEVVRTICNILEQMRPLGRGTKASSYRDLITFVKDRRGHDQRYAVNTHKIKQKLGWGPIESFETGMPKMVDWYVNHQSSTKRVTDYYKNRSKGLGLA